MDFIKRGLGRLTIYNTRGFWAGFIVGLFYFSWIFWWFWDLYPLDSLGIQSKLAAAILIVIVFSLCVIISAIFWGLFGFFFQKFCRQKTNLLLLPLILAATFALAEYSRAVFFSIFWYGNGGAIGPYWTFGSISYLLANIELVLLSSSWWGIYGVNFLLVWALSPLVIFFINCRTGKRKWLLFFETGLAIAVFGLAGNYTGKPISASNSFIPVAVIQTNIPSAGFSSPDEKLEDFRKKLLLLEEAAKTIKGGMIIFPESSNFLKDLSQFLNAEQTETYFKNLSKQEFLIFDSLRLFENEKFKSRSALISSQDGLISFYDKQILTPGGEFLPYIVKLPLILLKPSLRKQFKTYREYEKGSGDNLLSYRNNNIQILICSELISSQKTRQNNPDFMIIMGSFSIWRGNEKITNQILAMNRYRAVENGKYLTLSANNGKSYIINPHGVIEKITQTTDYELLTGGIVPNKNRTWYNYVGDWSILLLSAALFGLSLKKKVTSH